TKLEKIKVLEGAARTEGIDVSYWEDQRTHLNGVPDNCFDPPHPLRCIYVPPSEVKARAQASRRTPPEEQPKSGTPEPTASTTPETSETLDSPVIDGDDRKNST